MSNLSVVYKLLEEVVSQLYSVVYLILITLVFTQTTEHLLSYNALSKHSL